MACPHLRLVVLDAFALLVWCGCGYECACMCAGLQACLRIMLLVALQSLETLIGHGPLPPARPFPFLPLQRMSQCTFPCSYHSEIVCVYNVGKIRCLSCARVYYLSGDIWVVGCRPLTLHGGVEFPTTWQRKDREFRAIFSLTRSKWW